MNKRLYLIILFLSCKLCYSQNLVPNSSFEQHTTCPFYQGEIYYAVPWMVPTTFCSTEYFHQCSTGPEVSVPVNTNGGGYQFAKTGVAYAGIYTFLIGAAREYLEVQLTSPLIMNKYYHFEMFINLYNPCKYTMSCIGVYFSDTLLSSISSGAVLPYTPQLINTPGNVFDTLNWTQVSGYYLAHGGENFITIGNFNNGANTDTTLYNSSSGSLYSYVYIDDVSLTLAGSAGIEETHDKISKIKLWPNPVSDKLHISAETDIPLEFILYDIASRKVLQQKFTSSALLNTEQLARGIYIYEVRNKNGVIKMGKVVKE